MANEVRHAASGDFYCCGLGHLNTFVWLGVGGRGLCTWGLCPAHPYLYQGTRHLLEATYALGGESAVAEYLRATVPISARHQELGALCSLYWKHTLHVA